MIKTHTSVNNKSIKVHIVGAGLAGSEAAWQCLRAGLSVKLYEMRPQKMTPAHETSQFAELVCSNTFKSKQEDSAPGQLKKEMRLMDSLILQCAEKAAVPAGNALGVDRKIFSSFVTQALTNHPNLEFCPKEVGEGFFKEICLKNESLNEQHFVIVATGPLSSDAITDEITRSGLVETEYTPRLFFYDAIAPIIDADSIDFDCCFASSRYDDGNDDYLNIPMTREEYDSFIAAVLAAEKTPLHGFEKTQYFESCLPIEVMAERGPETLRFGPMKPVGLTDPKTGRWPYAAIQLRKENLEASMWSMVGFQTKMTWPAQRDVFRSIPALRNAEFFRFGSVHRNTYFESPKILNSDLSFRKNPRIFLAGQITGVEGYTESAAMGLMAGRAIVSKAFGHEFLAPPAQSMIGALLNYVTQGSKGPFQPMNANLGLLPSIPKQKNQSKMERKAIQCKKANDSFEFYFNNLSMTDQAGAAAPMA